MIAPGGSPAFTLERDARKGSAMTQQRFLGAAAGWLAAAFGAPDLRAALQAQLPGLPAPGAAPATRPGARP